MKEKIYTIGHSTHSIEAFLLLLETYKITAICDVRSAPYSKYNPQFNRETLKDSLREQGIQYVFLGSELGARSDDQACYKDGKVQYDRLAKTNLFRGGIERIQNGSRDFTIALMCSEKEPLECHRTILVSREIEKEGFQIVHILSNGKVEIHDDAIKRLIQSLNMDNDDLFMTEPEIKEKAYCIQANNIGYTISDENVETLKTVYGS